MIQPIKRTHLFQRFGRWVGAIFLLVFCIGGCYNWIQSTHCDSPEDRAQQCEEDVEYWP